MKRFWLLLAGAAAALLLAGCGDEATETGTAQTQRSEPRASLQVNLPGKAGPEEAGFLLAHRLGYFPRRRVHVWFVTPSHPARVPMYVEEELVDAAIGYGPQLILAREQGKPLVAVGSIIPHPTMAMIWLEASGIDSVADLKGKTIAIPGIAFQRLFLEAVLDRAGLTLADVKLRSVSYHLESELIQGRADAIFGGSMNTEGKLLEARGLEPAGTPARQLGIPDHDELILIARRDRYAEEPETFDRALEATVRGGAAVTERPGAATKAILRHSEYENSARPYLRIDPRAARAGVEAVAPRFSRTGEIDKAKLERLVGWMYAEGMIERRWSVPELLASP